MAINVTVWNEFHHEKVNDVVKAIYPDGIHAYIKSFLDKEDDLNVTICSLDPNLMFLPPPRVRLAGRCIVLKKSATP